MPVVDLTFKGLLEGNFFNFIIVFALLVWLFIKYNASRALDDAKNEITESIQKSDDEKNDSIKTLEQAKNEVNKLPDKLVKISEDAKKTVDSFKKAAATELEQTLKRYEENAEKVINTEIQKVNNALQKELAIKVIDAAQEKTLNRLENESDLHRDFISKAIDKIEETEIK